MARWFLTLNLAPIEKQLEPVLHSTCQMVNKLASWSHRLPDFEFGANSTTVGTGSALSLPIRDDIVNSPKIHNKFVISDFLTINLYGQAQLNDTGISKTSKT